MIQKMFCQLLKTGKELTKVNLTKILVSLQFSKITNWFSYAKTCSTRI